MRNMGKSIVIYTFLFAFFASRLGGGRGLGVHGERDTDTEVPTNLTTMTATTTAFVFPTFAPSFESCKQFRDDACQLQNNSIIDLKPLCNLIEGQPKKELSATGGHSALGRFTVYHFNPCKGLRDLPKPCIGDVASCQEVHKATPGAKVEYDDIGVLPPTVKTLSGELLMLFLPENPSNNSTMVRCSCNGRRIRDPLLRHLDQSTEKKEVLLKLEHVCCCADACANGYLPDVVVEVGYSTGTIMLITFFAFFAAYLVFGVIYNFRDGEHGIYMIPNLMFWRQCAKDVSLGFKFCVGGLNNSGNQTYGNLDGETKGGNFGEDIAVNYHNPNFDQRRPDYPDASAYALSNNERAAGASAATAAAIPEERGNAELKDARAASLESNNDIDEEINEDGELSEVFAKGNETKSGYGAI